MVFIFLIVLFPSLVLHNRNRNRNRKIAYMTSLRCMTAKMTHDYFQAQMPYNPIECIFRNSYGRLKEPHRFRLTDETKAMPNKVKNLELT